MGQGGLADGSDRVFATFGAGNGLPSLIFTDANGAIPTTALVNEVLQSLAYQNTSQTPAASATIDLIFNDGGSNSATVSTTITITDVPNGSGVIGDYVWNDVNRNGVQDAGEQGKATFKNKCVDIAPDFHVPARRPKGRIAGLCNPLGNAAGERKDKQDSSVIFERCLRADQ